MTIQELFYKLLSFKSLTPDDAGSFLFIKQYLNDFKIIEQNINGVKNLFLYKKFNDTNIHLCFAGHLDVVPAGNGWDTDPFIPTLKDDKIYARGAQDMKSGVCAFLKAAKETKSFNGTLSLLLTSDEEGPAIDGTIKMLEHLKAIDFLPNYAVVAEPTCENLFGDAIKVGRRGSINGILRLQGLQGHAAYPSKAKNPINLIAPILEKIAGKSLDNGDEYFAPSEFVITDIRSGMEVTNVTPGELKMMFNIRNSTNTSKEDIERFIDINFKGLDYSLDINISAKPFVTDKSSLVIEHIRNSIKEVLNINSKLSTAGGTSDARYFGEFKIEGVEFGVINDTIHAPNECTKLEYVEGLEKIFKVLISKF